MFYASKPNNLILTFSSITHTLKKWLELDMLVDQSDLKVLKSVSFKDGDLVLVNALGYSVWPAKVCYNLSIYFVNSIVKVILVRLVLFAIWTFTFKCNCFF